MKVVLVAHEHLSAVAWIVSRAPMSLVESAEAKWIFEGCNPSAF